ncbi:MAG: hypothetical protein JWP16_1159, partial [Alphaproteobacteria bacterium]|nr:hypothetical protein [Alphaproteobacteria bacterium]
MPTSDNKVGIDALALAQALI